MTDRELKEIRDLYNSGLSTRQISEKTGWSKSQVYKVCKDLARSKSVACALAHPARSSHWRSSRASARRLWKRTYGDIPAHFHVHHKNGDYTDNRLENLQLLHIVDHAYLHHPHNPVPRHLRPERIEYMRKWKLNHPDYWVKRKKEVASEQ